MRKPYEKQIIDGMNGTKMKIINTILSRTLICNAVIVPLLLCGCSKVPSQQNFPGDAKQLLEEYSNCPDVAKKRLVDACVILLNDITDYKPFVIYAFANVNPFSDSNEKYIFVKCVTEVYVGGELEIKCSNGKIYSIPITPLRYRDRVDLAYQKYSILEDSWPSSLKQDMSSGSLPIIRVVSSAQVSKWRTLQIRYN